VHVSRTSEYSHRQLFAISSPTSCGTTGDAPLVIKLIVMLDTRTTDRFHDSSTAGSSPCPADLNHCHCMRFPELELELRIRVICDGCESDSRTILVIFTSALDPWCLHYKHCV
jgi:hypothetical protein